jgi:hypothetical protein
MCDHAHEIHSAQCLACDVPMFSVGDAVALCGGNTIEMCRVASIGDRVELDDGSWWTLRGRALQGDCHIEPWSERHERAQKLREMTRLARNLLERLGEQNVSLVYDCGPLVDELASCVARERKRNGTDETVA